MNIRVDLNYPIKDGTEVVFRSPVDCSQVTGLKVYYRDNWETSSKEFAFADAHGNNVGDIPHLFAENVVVKVILDVTTGMAFVQNADTNAYLEAQLASKMPIFKRSLSNCSENDILEAGGYAIAHDNRTNVTDGASQIANGARFLLVFNSDTSNTRVLQLEGRSASNTNVAYAGDLFFRILIKGGAQNPWKRIGDPLKSLWKNASPMSTFAAQTLNIDLSNYSAVIVNFKGISNKYRMQSILVTRNFSGTRMRSSRVRLDSGTANQSDRGFFVNFDSNTIVFEACEDIATTDANLNEVPIEIIGIWGDM